MQTDLPQPDVETWLILNHQTGRYIRLGPREYDWLTRLDGQVKKEQVAAYLGMEAAFAEEFLRRLEAAKLILFSDEPIRVERAKQETFAPAPARAIEWAQFGQLRIRITGADKLLAKLASVSLLRSKLFIALMTWIGLLGVAISVRLLQVANLTNLLQTFVLHTWQIAVLIALIFVTTAFHELGHAVVCTFFGAPVRSMGIMLYYLQPAAYADVTDSWRLKNKWHRVAISAAGAYVQALVNALAVVVLLALRITGHRSNLLLLYVAMNLVTMGFNLVPFVKLDGYWILSTILGIPNLRDRALEWLRVFVLSKVTRRPINEKALRYNAVMLMTPMGRSLLACFGISSNVFGAAMWAGGLSFLFQVSGWLGISRGRSYFFVGGLLLVGIIAFVVRLVLARRRPAQSAPVPAPQPAAMIRHSIDRTRPVRLNPFATVLDDHKGTLVFAWTSADQLAVQGGDKIRELLPNLRRGITLRELEEMREGWDTQTETIFQRLWQLKQVRYSTDWDIQEDEKRYSRQLGWLSFNIAARGAEKAVLSRLKTKSVAILGVGGVGSNVALNIAACGIGEVHLVDGDNIEMSNLNRQLLYRPSDVGRTKVEVAAERLTQFNPALKVRTTKRFLNSVHDVMNVIEGADFVIRALDTPVEAQMWVNEACVRKGIPSTGAGFMTQGAVIGPTVIPGESACLACHQEQLPWLDRGMGATLAPVVTITAGILANEVITYLGQLGQLRTTTGILFVEAPTLAINHREASRDENCRVCGARKAVAV